jgi:hypothetical protein
MGRRDFSETPIFLALLFLRLAGIIGVAFILGYLGKIHDYGFLFFHSIH